MTEEQAMKTPCVVCDGLGKCWVRKEPPRGSAVWGRKGEMIPCWLCRWRRSNASERGL